MAMRWMNLPMGIAEGAINMMFAHALTGDARDSCWGLQSLRITEPLISVFMTRRDLECFHEPFGDAFYFGPERLSARFENDELTRTESGFHDATYKDVFDRIEHEGAEGKRVFIKDILHYLLPPNGEEAQIAPSLGIKKRGIGTSQDAPNGVNGVKQVNGQTEPAPWPYHTAAETGNPTVVPREFLEKFHFTFLIRDPHSSIPSYYRCTIPPLLEMTGWHDFWPNEAGYDELRRFFDFMRQSGQIGPKFATAPTSDGEINGNGVHTNGDKQAVEICVVDADDLLDDPEGIMKSYCKSVGIDFTPEMLNWDSKEHQEHAKDVFEKWKGFHEDAIDSKDLKPRSHKKRTKSEEQWDQEWRERYGEEAAKVIRNTVDENMDNYLYLKQFTVKAH